MVDFKTVAQEMTQRAAALYSLILSVQGRLSEVDLHYSSDEDLNHNQAVVQYLWRETLPEVEPLLIEPSEDIHVVLVDGKLGDRPHSWIAVRATSEEISVAGFSIIIDAYFPGGLPTVFILDSSSPIFGQYSQEREYGVGELE
jgi:hypothetical protein